LGRRGKEGGCGFVGEERVVRVRDERRLVVVVVVGRGAVELRWGERFEGFG
jgi:hypothetical protein